MSKFLGEEFGSNSMAEAAAVIVPIPYEFSTSYGKGTKHGPDAIIKSSPYLELYDEEFKFEPWKAGIYTSDPVCIDKSPKYVMQSITDSISHLLHSNKFIISLGGEHTISYAIYNAFHAQYEGLSILQLDAHSDLRDEYMGSKYNHACVMRRIWEKNRNIVQVGIRSQCIDEHRFILQNNIKTYYAFALHESGFGENIIDQLTNHVYLTIDVDFFDPAIMPSTGTPEPGGFQWYETVNFIKRVFMKKKVVGVDIVELSPQKNLAHPDFSIAKLVYKIIALKILTEKDAI
jgi:agmatinase